MDLHNLALAAVLLCATVAPSAVPAAAAPASQPAAAAEPASCIARAEQTPDAGFESALAWEDRGGGDHARLCQALALFHRGQFEAAAQRLEALVPTLGAQAPEAAASLLGRAGWAWLRAGQPGRAEAAYTQAIGQQPDDPELLVDRAFARAEAERFHDARDDLDRAIALRPGTAEAYVYRAQAHRELGDLALARDDVARALELAPADPEALLLRGNLSALAGDVATAREDWSRVVRIDPGTTTARAARENLERFAAARGKEER